MGVRDALGDLAIEECGYAVKDMLMDCVLDHCRDTAARGNILGEVSCPLKMLVYLVHKILVVKEGVHDLLDALIDVFCGGHDSILSLSM